jgi:peptidoglycan/xylan/chitin deacetylase (PgdA/CDA1 family)
MHASWFRKPVYNGTSIIAISTLLGSGILTISNPHYWFVFLILAILWTIFFLSASFIINSGVYLKSICSGPAENRKIAITFDDGPDLNTTGILEILAKYNAKASFFLIGEKAEKNWLLVQKIKNANHTVGNHTYNHKPYFPIMGVKKISKNIADTQAALQKITGAAPIYFRPPFGVTNPLIANALKTFNLIIIGWSVRSFDTIIKDPEKVLTRITTRLRPGSIILLHDTTKNAVQILEGLLLYCEKQNLTPVTLDELIRR